MNESIDDCLRTLDDLKRWHQEFSLMVSQMFQAFEDTSISNTSKEYLENASKSSSGYDDEEFNDHTEEDEETDTSGVSVRLESYEGECSEEIVVISDDEEDVLIHGYEEEDYDGWTVCSDTNGEHYMTYYDQDDDEANSQSSDRPVSTFRVVDHLRMYPPSEEMKSSNVEHFSLKSVKDCNDVIKSYVDNFHLGHDNIQPVLTSLLEIEDITCLSEYPALAQKDININWTFRMDYWIPIHNVANIDDIVVPFMDELVLIPKGSSLLTEATPSKYPIDTLFPHPHEYEKQRSLRRRVATIFKISKTEVHFRFNKKEGLEALKREVLSGTKYDILIRPRRLPVRYQRRALEMLGANEHVRQYLFPQVNLLRELHYESKLNLTLFNQTIASNPEQLEAVRFLTDGPHHNAPYVIFGPPGTGKTTTIVESILQLRLHNPRSRILVTAGSNSACDTIALRICKYFNSNPRLQVLQQQGFDNAKSIIRIYSKTIVEKGIHLIDPELKKHSNIYRNYHYYPAVNEIRKYGIIVATLCTVGKLVTGHVGQGNFFTHIFIDEAGASTEPEALVGIMGIKSRDCRVILSGDHKQLGPILKSDRAIQLGLDKSLMQRLLESELYAVDENANYDHTLQARLKRNYRSHPEIVRIFNHLYYNNELIAEAKLDDVNMASKWNKLTNPNFPIIFQAVHGITEKDTITPSSRNNLELQVLMWFLQRLLVDGIDGRPVAQSDIGIITPYRLQNNIIQSCLKSRGWENVDAGSVETFQGREKQIIIVSLVRSFSGLGFVKNPKRLNVILSRAKSLLILIGNPLTFRRHPDFEFIMDECRSHGTFLRKKRTRNRKLRKALPPLPPSQHFL